MVEERGGWFVKNVKDAAWVDSEAFNLVKIRSSAGVEVAFGPVIAFGKRVKFPKWWTVQEPDKPIVRFEVNHVRSVTAPGSAFRKHGCSLPRRPRTTRHPTIQPHRSACWLGVDLPPRLPD